jgi:SAM-dependent methyltransferase
MREAQIAEMRDLEDRYWWFIARRRLAVGLLDDARIEKPRSLDAGCGAGALLRELAARGEALGIDLAAPALAITARRGLQRLVQADASDLPFREGAFDAVMLCDVLEHVEDDRRALAEAARVLRPGGAVVITLPALALLWSNHDEALGHYRRYHPARVREMLVGSGLRVEKMSFGLFFFFPIALVLRPLQRLLAHRRNRPPETGIIRVPAFLNRLLIKFMDLENALIRRVNLPVGVSLVAVGRKPTAAE